MRIIAFGAHPDDCELCCGGTTAKWVRDGHAVKYVSLTNGNVGHFTRHGDELAAIRRAEVEQCARILGIETQVLDINDGELEPSLANRQRVIRLIRDWQADIVLCHRPNDYHPDHRYTGQLVQDAAVLLLAKFYLPDVPALERNPVFLYYADEFQKPVPFTPSVVVGIDDVIDVKRALIDALPSQFADRDSWMGARMQGLPDDDDGRRIHIREWLLGRERRIAQRFRTQLADRYGADDAGRITHAEAFERSEYGAQLSDAKLDALFPR
ncbi:MAG: PIG-L family deacetylase [Pseudomonadales bacterium]|nr:PIG-L family deacetylase [Pseudomonadales bacterium]